MTTITDRRRAGLPTVLRVDGWSTALFGAVMITGGAALLSIAGHRPHRYGRVVVAVNAASAVGMTALACSGLLPLTALGIGFLLTGAVLVATFAALEFAGLRAALR